jgi:hypothetical protein
MFKPFLSVLAGLFTAFLVVLLLETILPYIFHVQPIDPKNKEEMEKFMSAVPKGLLIANAISYGFAALAGSFVTILIIRNSNRGYITTLIFLIVVLVNFFSFKHPAWMITLGAAATIVGGYIGTKLKKNII